MKSTTSGKVLAHWLTFEQWKNLKGQLRVMGDCMVSVEFTEAGLRVRGDMDGIEADKLLADMMDRDGSAQ